MRFVPQRFTDRGVPVYDLAAGEMLADGRAAADRSGGDQALVEPDGWTVLTRRPEAVRPAVAGRRRSAASRAGPIRAFGPGLHASHESPPPDRPGEVIGTTRLLGGFVTPRGSDAGPLWAINGNKGNMYLFTADGLFVAELFHDVRQGIVWAMPMARATCC